MKKKKTAWVKPACIAAAIILVLGGLGVGIAWGVKNLTLKDNKAAAESVVKIDAEHNATWQTNAVKAIENFA